MFIQIGDLILDSSVPDNEGRGRIVDIYLRCTEHSIDTLVDVEFIGWEGYTKKTYDMAEFFATSPLPPENL